VRVLSWGTRNLTSITHANSNHTQFTYDALGRVTKTTFSPQEISQLPIKTGRQFRLRASRLRYF